MFDGQTEKAGKFLVAEHSWTSFNQGPILNLDLSAVPHDRVRVRFDLYTFGDWRGLQQSTGGPQHRLMFFDNKAQPEFAFDTNFATNEQFQQSWPERNPARHDALTGAQLAKVDTTGRHPSAHLWPIDLEYPSDSSSLRFAILCGAAAGSGQPMPHFGIDNVEVLVRSTVPTITAVDRPDEVVTMREQAHTEHGRRVDFDVPWEGRTSVGVFDIGSGRLVRTLLTGERLPAREHSVEWDGLDNSGKRVPSGRYEWRRITTPGFTAQYVTTVGINPPGGEHPVPRRSWVGDHNGGGIVDVDDSGVYVGSPMTEGLMMLAKVDSELGRVAWTREQFYQSGRLTKAAASGMHVFMLHPGGKLRRLNRETGKVEKEWQIAEDGSAPVDVDARGWNLAVVDATGNAVRWFSVESGKELAAARIESPTSVAAIDATNEGEVAVASGNDIVLVQPGHAARNVVTLSGTIGAMDYDPERKELWAVVDGHQVVRLSEQFRVAQTYGDQPRELGPFDATRFAGVYDLAADLNGGFYLGEPAHPPRRIAHLARDGSLIEQWFGGMSFYVGGTFDPADPSRLYGIAPEGCVNVYDINYDDGAWEMEATYATGRLGDGMFPNAGAFQAVRRNGETYLYHRVVPSVLRLDPKLRTAVPVAIAGRVLNRGRTFFQFAGTGRDGYPQPWVAAAEHHGYRDLSQAPKLYSWADSNGNGEFEVDEFRFYPHAKRGLSFHNPGDFTAQGDYIGTANTNENHALVRLPVSEWEGPRQSAPRWNWDGLTTDGEVVANPYGYGSPRSVTVHPDGSVTAAYQAGIMIRGHGQYEGGGWPEAALRGSRVLGFDSQLQPMFAVGRQSKQGSEADTGVLYYPMRTTHGPNGCVIVNDQTKQPAQVWTHDGLYVGGFFDNRADDGRAPGFYRVHGDDNQGATVVTAKSGKTYWLMPYQGHNRLYEISGWDNWNRQKGTVDVSENDAPASPHEETGAGAGLSARYSRESEVVLKTVEAPIYFERLSSEPHADVVSPPYKVVWTGFVAPPVTDRFRFHSLIGKGERVAVWIDGRVVHANGLGEQDYDTPVELVAGAASSHSYRVRQP